MPIEILNLKFSPLSEWRIWVFEKLLSDFASNICPKEVMLTEISQASYQFM
jgi:hypothetical protein